MSTLAFRLCSDTFCKASCFLQARMPSSLMVCLMPAVRAVFKPCCDPSTVRGPSRFSVSVCWISEQWWKRHQEASANRNIILQVNRLLWWCDDSYHTLSGTFKKEPKPSFLDLKWNIRFSARKARESLMFCIPLPGKLRVSLKCFWRSIFYYNNVWWRGPAFHKY